MWGTLLMGFCCFISPITRIYGGLYYIYIYIYIYIPVWVCLRICDPDPQFWWLQFSLPNAIWVLCFIFRHAHINITMVNYIQSYIISLLYPLNSLIIAGLFHLESQQFTSRTGVVSLGVWWVQWTTSWNVAVFSGTAGLAEQMVNSYEWWLFFM
jgi:hypothetical protein